MNLIEQSIENCHMTHKHENPGVENGMCAGLRMLCGEGEPCEECKECRLYYGHADEHDIRKTNADRIRSMSDDELTDIILCPYDTAGKPANIMPCVRDGNIQELVSPEYCKKCMMDWLQSEVEE